MKKHEIILLSAISTVIAIFSTITLLLMFRGMSTNTSFLAQRPKSPRLEAMLRKKWPAGIDTSAEWQHGKYQIIMDSLNEFEDGHNNKSHVLQSKIEQWYRDGDLVFLFGEETFGVLDVNNLIYTKFKITNVVEDYQHNFEILIHEVDPRIRNIKQSDSP